MAGKGELVVNAQARLKRGCDESILRPVQRGWAQRLQDIGHHG